MPTTITPVSGYIDYPIIDVPINGESTDISKVVAILQDIYNRLVYLKDNIDTNVTDITAVEDSVTALTAALVISNNNIAVNVATLAHLATNIGGGVENATPDNFDTPRYLTNGDTHRVCIEKLDEAIYTVDTALTALSPTVATNTSNIAKLVQKVSDDALDGAEGFEFTDANYLASGDKIDEALLKLDTPILANRRINNFNFIQTIKSWRDISFGEAGGATPANYFYDSLYDNTKINATYSTDNCYNSVTQSFGRDDIGWNYFSNIQTIPSGINRVKLIFNGLGTVTPYINLQGSYSSGFLAMVTVDSWTEIITGTQMIVRFIGSAAARVYNYAILYKEV